MRQGLTVAMIVRDEASNLRELLPGVVERVDDVVVVDTGSEDGTVAVAESFGARVFVRPWDDDFSAARNHGLAEVRTAHTLWLDADDRIAAASLTALRTAATVEPDAAFSVELVAESPNPDFVSRCRQVRVFPTRPEHRFRGRVHEQIASALQATGTPIVSVQATVRHLGYESPETVRLKSERNLALSRREWEEGNRGIVATYQYVMAASLCGAYEEGAEVTRGCLDSPPRDAAADILQHLRVMLGHFEEKRGRAAHAEFQYRDAVACAPLDPWANWHLAEVLRKSGRPAEAVGPYEIALTGEPISARIPLPLAGLRRSAREGLAEARLKARTASCSRASAASTRR